MEPLQANTMFQFTENDYITCIVILTVLLSFMTYWFTIHSNVFHKWCTRNFNNKTEKFKKIIVGRYFGFVVLGLIPLSIIELFTNYSISSLGILPTQGSLSESLFLDLGFR